MNCGRNGACNPAVDYYLIFYRRSVRQFSGQCHFRFDKLVAEQWVEGIW
jgi:hypothetical protein